MSGEACFLTAHCRDRWRLKKKNIFREKPGKFPHSSCRVCEARTKITLGQPCRNNNNEAVRAQHQGELELRSYGSREMLFCWCREWGKHRPIYSGENCVKKKKKIGWKSADLAHSSQCHQISRLYRQTLSPRQQTWEDTHCKENDSVECGWAACQGITPGLLAVIGHIHMIFPGMFLRIIKTLLWILRKKTPG